MARRDDLRLITRVARLYYDNHLKQPQIAERLRLSQAKVSRLLRQALELDIVRISVRIPPGVHADLEEDLETRYGLLEAVVVDTTATDEGQMLRDLGHAAAFLLETTLRSGDVVGISSWSATLLSTVRAMHPVTSATDVKVVQLLGGVGNPAAEIHATELTRQLAELVKGVPVLLPVPGVVGSAAARNVLENDDHVRTTLQLFPLLTVALIGIGSVEPSPLLARSGNVFSADELKRVAVAGAVGDVCLRFFDAAGNATANELDERVIGLTLDELRRVPRTIAVAGGGRKLEAIRGALSGGLVSQLVTDRQTAQSLLESGATNLPHHP